MVQKSIPLSMHQLLTKVCHEILAHLNIGNNIRDKKLLKHFFSSIFRPTLNYGKYFKGINSFHADSESNV